MPRCGGAGRPITSCYGEAIAILAAFGLLDAAFGTIARSYEPALASQLTALLSDAVGGEGLIGGQAADLLATDQRSPSRCWSGFTAARPGALFSAAATAGALTAGAPAESIAALQAFAKNLGLAFQIIDDLLDVEGDPAVTGKPVREDAEEDHVRVVQRTGRGPAARHRAVPHRRPRAGAVRPARGAAARALGVRGGEDRASRVATPPDPRLREVDDLRQQLRSLGYLDAGVDRFVLGAGARHRGADGDRLLASLRIGVLAAVLLGPAAAIGVAARVPGLITGARDGFVVAAYLGAAVRRGEQRRRVFC